MPQKQTQSLEETRPRLVPEVAFIPYTPHVTWLKNTRTGTFLKLTAQEAVRAREFDGTRTFSDILHHHAELDKSSDLLKITELLFYLKSRGFIVEDPLPDASPSRRSGEALHASQIPLPWTFGNAILQKTAHYAASTLGLLFLTLLPVACIIASSDYREMFFDFGNPPLGSGNTLLKYLSGLALLWLSVNIIISFKNILSAYAVAGAGHHPVSPRITLFWGFIFFDCTITDIVSAGQLAAVRLYVLRLLTPLLLLHVITAFGPMVAGVAILSIFKKACILVTAFSVMPLIKTDLNNLLFLITGSTRDFKQTISYLGKRYFTRLNHFTLQPSGGNDFCYIVSLITILWLVVMGNVLWNAFMDGVLYFADGFKHGFSLQDAYIPLESLVMLAPFIGLTVMALFVGTSNLSYALRSPLNRLRNASGLLHRRKQADPAVVEKFLGELPLFSVLSDSQRAKLACRFELISYGPRADVVLQGDPGDAFYVIISGTMRVVLEDECATERTVAVLSTGDCFGEIALIEKVPRTATVRTITAASLLKLDKHHFDDFLAALPLERGRITDQIRHGKLLMSIPLFSYLSPEQFSYLIARSALEIFKTGEIIFEQGDTGEKLYIVKSGAVTVKRVESSQTVFSKALGPGSVFGEIALVKHVPRTAQAAAAEDAVLLSIGKDVFYELINKSLLTGTQIDRLADRRIAELTKSPITTV